MSFYLPPMIPIQARRDNVFLILPSSSRRFEPLKTAHSEFLAFSMAVPPSDGIRDTRVTCRTPSPTPLNETSTVEVSSNFPEMSIFVRLINMLPTSPSLQNDGWGSLKSSKNHVTYFKLIVWEESTPPAFTLMVSLPSTLFPNTFSLRGRCKWTINR